MAKQAPTRRVYMDYLNVLAMMFVVWQHARIHFYWPKDVPGFWFELVVSSVAVAAVPIFFMISGANLMDFPARYDLRTYLRRRVLRVGVPYLIWTQVYIVAAWVRGDVAGPGQWVAATFRGSTVAPPFWYIEVLLGIYLVLPVFAYMVAGLGESWRGPFVYVTALAVVAAALLPLARQVWPGFLGTFELPLAGYLMFALLGYLLVRVQLSRHAQWGIGLLGAVGIAAFIALGGPLSIAGSDYAPFAVGYLALPALAIAAAFFVAARALPTHRWARMNRLVGRVSSWTFGIYLMHYAILGVLQAIRPIDGVLEGIAYAAVAWLLSALATALGRTVPFVRRWVLP